MSIINEAAHNVTSYISGSTKAFIGQRLSVVSYKTVQDKESAYFGIKKESKAVSIPKLSSAVVQESIDALMPIIIDTLEGLQDKVIRKQVDEGKAFITAESISIAALVEQWNSVGTDGERITKDSVKAWFDSNIAEVLMITLSDRMGISTEAPSNAESQRIEMITASYREKISSLAGGKTSFEPKLAESIVKALKLAGDDDKLAVRFIARCEKMIAENTGNELLNAL